MNLIKVNGFNIDEKLNICKKFILPKIYNEYKFDNNEIIIKDDVLKTLILNNNNEKGVRTIKKILEHFPKNTKNTMLRKIRTLKKRSRGKQI